MAIIDFSAVEVGQTSIHQVGNRSADEGCFVSEQPVIIDQGLADGFSLALTRSFKHITEWYHFSHNIDAQYHVLEGLTRRYFEELGSQHEVTAEMARHLYEQSSHPHIKSGDLIIISLNNVLLEDEVVDAIAIVKAETKQRFFKVQRAGTSVNIDIDSGMQIQKLDKAAIICNTRDDDGYRVMSIDNNRYDASYWLHSFLGIAPLQDYHYQTKAYVELCKSFATEVVGQVADKKDQVDFLHQSIKYISESEQVDQEDFKTRLFADSETAHTFDQYKAKYESEIGVEIPPVFDVSADVMKKQKQKLRNFIKLDTNIKIQLGFSNTDSVDRFIEKGWDEDKGMYYYKCYFNYET